MSHYNCATESYSFPASVACSQFCQLKSLGEHRRDPPRPAHSRNWTQRVHRTAVEGSSTVTLALRPLTAAVDASTARALGGASYGSEGGTVNAVARVGTYSGARQ